MNAPATARLTAARPADLARGAAVGLLVLLVSIAAILGWRRAAGAMAVPLDLAGLLLAALLVAACAAGVRLAWLWATAGARRAASRINVALAALVTLVVLTIGLLVSLPGTTLAGGLLLWIALAAEELCTWRLVLGSNSRAEALFVSPGGHAGRVLPGATAGLSSSAGADRSGESTNLGSAVGRIANPSSQEADLPDGLAIRPTETSPSAGVPGEDVLQQLTRTRTADGGELLSGWLRVDLAAGQRTANLHVAFCPPFTRAPRISVQQVDGPETRVKTVQTLPYGVRFDLKVADEEPEASTLLLQFAAEVSAASV